MITDLLVSGGRAAGAVGIDRLTGAASVFRAKAVVLAAGDCSFRGNYVGTDAATGDAFCLAYDVCILKEAGRLAAALRTVEELRDAAVPRLRAADGHELAKAHETANMVQVAEMFLRASLARTESRGDHLREDHPRTDMRDWLKWVTLRKDADGCMQLAGEPVPFDRYPLRPPAQGAQ